MSNTAKSLASERIHSLLDENSFVEIGGAVTARSTDFNLSASEAQSDGVITGYGVINGQLVYVYSQDADVLGGTVGEMHARKITSLYEMAMKMGAPVIALIDSAGLRLQEATDALNAFGQIYRSQACASGIILQVAAIFGNCGGGMAIASGLADFTFMESTSARLYVNTPNAFENNTKEKNDTASCAFQSEAGNTDFTGTEQEILAGIRQLVSMLPVNNEDEALDECADDLNRICQDLENAVGDPAVILSQIADDHYFLETKSAWAKDMVTGFLKLNGQTVGAVANRSVRYDENGNEAETFSCALTPDGCEKAAKFVEFCDAFEIPVLTLTNAAGYEARMCAEKRMARAAAKLTFAFADATVPKVNIVIGKAFGSAYNVMNCKALGADYTYAWPQAQIGMMDASLAAGIMYAGEDGELIKEKAQEYAELQSSAQAAARRGYVDTIIEAQDTRKYVIGAFEMLYSKREDRPFRKHGTV